MRLPALLCLLASLAFAAPERAFAQGDADSSSASGKKKRRTRKSSGDPATEAAFQSTPSSEGGALGPRAKVIEVKQVEAYGDVPASEEAPAEELDYLETRRRARDRLEPEETGRMAWEDEKGLGLGVELMLGLALVDQGTGGSSACFGFGLDVDWKLGHLFAPENELLYRGLLVEFSYLHASDSAGTNWVQVNGSYHNLAAAILFGYPFTHVLVYGKLGPGLFIMPVEYDVKSTYDGASDLTSFTGVKGGIVYGVGARADLMLGETLGLASRLEIIRYRRGYLDDTMFLAGVGAVF